MSDLSQYIAIFGGAVSGAEAAYQFGQRGIRSVVFEQQALPYGKIEDGLPKWHVKLRDKEEGSINEKLDNEMVDYVPNIKLGEDISFEEVTKMGFSAVILATGAWKDRPLPIDGVEDFIGKGFYYQNPFIYWFNHKHETAYDGKNYEIGDGAIVIGGGLASMDVVKVLMMETVEKALAEKGHKVDLFKLDKGINKTLEELGLTLDDLGLKGCTLYYRRRNIDMPLSPADPQTPEEVAKVEMVRGKILETYKKRFLFNFEPNMMPVDKIVEDDKIVGIVFQKTEVKDGKVIPIEGSLVEVKGSVVISSIGSIPELIEGVPASGSVYDIKDRELCQIEGYDNVFAIGNAVTGRGNINESLKHGKEVSSKIMDQHLNWTQQDFEEFLRHKEAGIAEEIAAISENLKGALSTEKITELEASVEKYQAKSGYDGDYLGWVKQHLPERLEDIIGVVH